jgi:hypothetical protein
MYTTLNEIKKLYPSPGSWEKLLRHLGKTEPDDEPLPLLTVLESSGLEETLLCLRAVEGFEREKRLLAVAFAREVEHLMPEASKPALAVAKRYANGMATDEELAQARSAARSVADAAARAANARAAAARAAADPYAAYAAYAARAAAHAAYATAADAARSAAYFAADDAAHAAAWDVVVDAAWVAWVAARSEMQAKQTQILRKFLEETL